ncbi:hypothetical protein SAMN05444351_1901 [Geodermatophilus nigrescens]|uniref:Leucine Rich repeat-containing protein n=1 Tax=Geodermatophilus nigrescens TaxID=1070870 RepID=A0A1M5I558_9ACTN|nr:hypothetical protein SAMN05444351_1901 [Geodermatophilus nigrescens]
MRHWPGDGAGAIYRRCVGWLSGGKGRVKPDQITRLDEYQGEAQVVVAATQLGTEYSQSQARRIVDEWAEFFSSGPSPIRALRFVSRTPRRLFEALRGQTQLEALAVKWGDFADLTPVAGMAHLRKLQLSGASSVGNLQPLAGLHRVEDLLIEGLRRVRDLSPIGDMRGVRDLELGGDWMTPRIVHVESFSFLRQMPQLRSLLLHSIAADDLDYGPVLELPNLTSVRVMEVRGMRPSIDVLKARTPWTE